MKKFNYAKIIILVLSLALIIGSVFAVTVAAQDDTTGKFGGISIAYGENVAIRVVVNATEDEIKNGDVVVSYELNGVSKNATYYNTDAYGVWVITEGIAAYDLAQVITFSSTANGVQVEQNRKCSVAQFIYAMLYTNNNLTTEYKKPLQIA